MTHPLVDQLRFTRSEFARAFQGVSDEDGIRRLLPLNCISWMVGHLAWQEQAYFLGYGELTAPSDVEPQVRVVDGLQHDADPPPSAHIAWAEEGSWSALDQRLLSARWSRQPHRHAPIAVVVLGEHHIDLAVDEERGLAV